MATRFVLPALAVLALLAGGAAAQESVGLTIQFNNRGSKVSDPKKAAQIVAAVADCICNVPVTQVKYSGTLGQSTLFNHQSVSTFECTGPTKTGKPLLKSCETNTKDGWFSRSNGKKCIKKYTDTWAVGDSVTLQKANCVNVKTASVKGGAATAPASAPVTAAAVKAPSASGSSTSSLISYAQQAARATQPGTGQQGTVSSLLSAFGH